MIKENGPHPGFKIKGLRWYITLLLMGITAVNHLDRSVLSVAAPTLKEQLDIKETNFSCIVMAFQLAYLIMMPVAGRIIDWLNMRLGFILSIIAWSIAQMATALATGWRSFALFRGLLGTAEAGNFPGAIKTVSQWFPPKERTVATGIFNIGAGLGALIAPPLVAFLILRYNWQIAFVVTGAFGFGWVVLWLVFYRSPEKHPWLSEKELNPHQGWTVRPPRGRSTRRERGMENCVPRKKFLGNRDCTILFRTRMAIFQLLDSTLSFRGTADEFKANGLFCMGALSGR